MQLFLKNVMQNQYWVNVLQNDDSIFTFIQNKCHELSKSIIMLSFL